MQENNITACFKNAFWIDLEHTAFHVDVTLSSGETYPFTYIVDGSDDNDGLVSSLTREAYHRGEFEIQSNKEIASSNNNGIVVENEARLARNQLLSETDFYMMPDYPISEESRNLIRVYRQLLRDVPQQEGFPENIIWPEKPDIN